MTATGGPTAITERATGVVRHVDAVNCELTVAVGGKLVTMSVPPACPVILRGERVKLRLVLPRDFVTVEFTRSDDGRVAEVVTVQPG